MFYKQTITLWLRLFFLALFIFFAFIFVKDPYNFFHKPWFHPDKMTNNMRVQNYGIIKFDNFDSIIIGTSMLENTSADEASQKLNAKFANLSMSAASYKEKYQVLQFAFKKKKIKRVILSFDYKFDDFTKVENTFLDLYEHDNIFNRFQSYLNTKALTCIFQNLDCDYIERNLDHPTAWYKSQWNARRFGGLDNWMKYKDEDYQIKDAIAFLLADRVNDYSADYKKIIDYHLAPLFKHKDTEFDIIIPPYSILWWSKAPNSNPESLTPYQYLIEKAKSFENVRIYWFYDQDFISDISVYKDLTHYHQSINALMLDAIKDKRCIIDSDNYSKLFADFQQRIKAYNLDKIISRIK